MTIIPKLASLLGKALPAAALLNKAKGMDPRLNGFISSSLLAGYGADKVLDFLQQKISGGGQETAKRDIEAKGTQALPHERAALAGLQGEDMPRNALAGLAGIGAGAATAGAASAGEALAQAAPTAKSIVEGFADKKLDPETAYNSFAEAGFGKAIDFLSGKASGEMAFNSLQKFTGPEFMETLSKRFNIPAQQVADLALQYAGMKGQQQEEQSMQQEVAPEVMPQGAPEAQEQSADQELLSAIQNIREMLK